MKKFLNITKKKKKESKEEIQTRSRKNPDGRISIEAESRFPAMKFRGGVDILRAKLTAERRRKCREKEPWGLSAFCISRRGFPVCDATRMGNRLLCAENFARKNN